MNFKINPDWRWNRGNHASILLNVSTAKVIIKPTLTFAHSGNITSTKSGIQRSIKNSVIDEWHTSMIVKNFRVFLQNVWKNKLLTDILLDINKDFNIIPIQEPLWSTLCSIPSSLSKEGEKIIRAPNHPN